jgi:hypothetical protein
VSVLDKMEMTMLQCPVCGDMEDVVTNVRISELPDSDFAKSRTAISVIPGQFGHG